MNFQLKMSDKLTYLNKYLEKSQALKAGDSSDSEPPVQKRRRHDSESQESVHNQEIVSEESS